MPLTRLSAVLLRLGKEHVKWSLEDCVSPRDRTVHVVASYSCNLEAGQLLDGLLASIVEWEFSRAFVCRMSSSFEVSELSASFHLVSYPSAPNVESCPEDILLMSTPSNHSRSRSMQSGPRGLILPHRGPHGAKSFCS